MPIGTFFLGYAAGINLLALIASGWDKLAAIRRRRRVPENTLMLLAVLLGGPGLYLSFFLFHHKVRKKKFMVGVPLIMAAQALAYVLVQRIWV